MKNLHRRKVPRRVRPCPPGGPGLAFCSLAGGDAVSVAAARLRAVGISGSPAATSKSRTLVAYALAQLEAGGAAARLVDLANLPADALLGRGVAPQVADALAAVADARIVVAGTPGYRAPPRGLLTGVFDPLPP